MVNNNNCGYLPLQWDFSSNKAQMMGKAGISKIGNGPFGNMQALLDFYETYPTFPAPRVGIYTMVHINIT